MLKYSERIVNVLGDCNCSYRASSVLLDKGDKYLTFVHQQLIKELKAHKESYTLLYEKKEHFKAIHESLIPYISGPTLEEKWLRFPKMGHLLENVYNRVFINMKIYVFSETFFPLRTAPPQNPTDRILCIGWLSKS